MKIGKKSMNDFYSATKSQSQFNLNESFGWEGNYFNKIKINSKIIGEGGFQRGNIIPKKNK